MQTSTAIIPSLSGPNLAPRLDQSKAETPKTPQPFQEWIKETTAKLERVNLDTWRELHLVWLLLNLYIEGKQMLRKRHRGFGFDVIPMPDSTAASVREQNKLGFYSQVLMSKWVSSRTKVEGVATDDSEESQELARLVEAILEDLQEGVYSEAFRQREAIGGQVCGSYARYFYYDGEADGGYTQEAITNESDVKLGEDSAQCLDCGYAGLATDFGSPFDGVNESAGSAYIADESNPLGDYRASEVEPAGNGSNGGLGATCPQCGSSFIQVDEMPAAKVVNIAGYQKKRVGKVVGKTVPYTRVRHEVGQSLEDSPWCRWKERIRIEEIKAMFPGIKVGTWDSQMRDSGLEVEDTMQRTVGGYQNTAMLGYWSKDRAEYGEVTHWWLTPPMYADYVFPIDIETQSGPIPAGTKATDAFPHGMHFILVSGCDQPLAMEDDCHRDHWVTAPYHLRFLAGTGIGINDAAEMQRQFNVVLGLVFTQIRTAAIPGWLYDKDTIAPDEIRKLGQPQMNVPVSIRNRPEGTRIEQLVHRMEPGQIPSHIPWYIGQLDANMQTTAGALINEGLPGVDSKTATGAQLNASAAQQHNSPEFALKGDADVRSAKLMLKLAHDNYDAPRFIRGKNGKQAGIWFTGAELDEGRVRLQAKRDSWLPNTRLDKQAGIEKVLALTGGIVGLLQLQDAAPDLLAQIEEAYDVTIHGESYTANQILCRQRVEQIKKLAPQFEQMAMSIAPQIDPMTGMPIDPAQMIAAQIIQSLQPPVVPEEPNHVLSIKWLRDWLVTDEGKEASPMVRASVIGLIHAHIEAAAMEAQTQGQMQMAAQMPAMEQQAAMQGQQQVQKSEADMWKESARANLKPGAGGAGGDANKRPNPRPKPMEQMG